MTMRGTHNVNQPIITNLGCVNAASAAACSATATAAAAPQQLLAFLLALVIMVASWKRALVRSSTSPSSNFMPFSSMQARITCCSSFSCISPSPEDEKKRKIWKLLNELIIPLNMINIMSGVIFVVEEGGKH